MAGKKNLYDLLGVTPSAAAEEILSAWQQRKAALQQALQQPGAEEHSRQELRNQLAFLQYAGETLSDPGKRARYDQSQLATEAPMTVDATLGTAAASSRRPGPTIPILLLTTLFGALAWQWSKSSPSQVVPAATRPAPPAATRVASESEAFAPTTAAADLTISSSPNGAESQGVPASIARSTLNYNIKINAENAPLVKKLAWSVYGIVGSRGLGSGILVEPEQLLTNCHVIAANVRHGAIYAVNAVTRERTEITAAAWLDHEDACLVRAPGLTGTIARGALQSPTALGSHTHNLGFALGELTASQGEVIGWTNRYGQNFLITSNYCDHGVSGGPLVDDDGRLIGLTTGGPASRAFCVSVTLDTIAKLRLERLKPLDLFPNNYSSNISRKN